MEPASCSLVSNPYPLDSREIMRNFSATYEDFPSCSCSSGDQNCPAGAYGPQPPMRKLNTKDTLIDLTGRDISEYLLKSTDEFVRKRWEHYHCYHPHYHHFLFLLLRFICP